MGRFEGDRLVAHGRRATEPGRPARELVSEHLDPPPAIVVVATSGPALDAGYRALFSELTGRPPIVLGADPVGPDRLADAAAAFELVGGACIVVDMGTATTVDVVDASGAWAGGVIAAGAGIATAALAARADRLPPVELRAPAAVVNRETVGALQAGAVLGHAGLVDGLVGRIREERAGDLEVVATGGLSSVIAPHCRTVGRVEPWLTLRGLAILGRRRAQAA